MISGFLGLMGLHQTPSAKMQRVPGRWEWLATLNPQPRHQAWHRRAWFLPTGMGVRGLGGARHTAVRMRLCHESGSKSRALLIPMWGTGQALHAGPTCADPGVRRASGCRSLGLDPLPAPKGTQSGMAPLQGVSLGMPQGQAPALLRLPVAHTATFT